MSKRKKRENVDVQIGVRVTSKVHEALLAFTEKTDKDLCLRPSLGAVIRALIIEGLQKRGYKV